MRLRIICFLFFIYSFLSSAFAGDEKTVQRKICFDNGWSFRLGELPNPKLQEKEDTTWKIIDLPHDWSIISPFLEQNRDGIATGHKPGGVGWYRKRFVLSGNEISKILTLYFEGVYMESEVWLNGKKVVFHPYGYISFRCDITDYCFSVGKENLLEVKVLNQGKNSRWYSGSGIYRHVWLISTEKIHFDTWNVAIKTDEITDNKSIINLKANIFNKTTKVNRANITIQILNKFGKQIAAKHVEVKLPANQKATFTRNISLINPKLWSIETPDLYLAKFSVAVDGELKDSITIPFGIRTISFSAANGFELNGQMIKLKGGCIHHDNGLLGAAAIDRAEVRKVEMLKANGFNAVRCAHNPPSETFLNACDSLGLLVIDEAFDQWQKPKNPEDYHRYFDEWGIEDITSMILRDRNHPCIIMWSIGNEIQERADSIGVLIAERLKNTIRKLDQTRPVTAAINDFWDNPDMKWKDSEPAFRNLDVGGYNYMWWEYDNDHKLYPKRIIFGSESTAMERAINWDFVEQNPYIIGDFIWTAIDYLGESGIGNTNYYDKNDINFPQFLDAQWFNAWCGDIDICGNRKPQSFFRDVIWGKSKIEMLVHAPVPDEKTEKISYWGWPDELASWNWNGHENELMDIRVFTRCPIVRLYLNNGLLEEKSITNDQKNRYIVSFKVPYRNGILKAAGVNNGVETDSILLKTSGKASKIRLKTDRCIIRASRNDLAYISIEIIDNKENIVPDEDVTLNLNLVGEGDIIAGNACPTDMESFRSLTPRTYRGKALAIIRPTGKPGKIILQVNNQNLGTASISINSK
ncbi:MAG: DUF4982 domain-containing protein [Bacteroidales bacterium]|nr:DUF4982 domain-containing protein [Bacteroidales bacterium]